MLRARTVSLEGSGDCCSRSRSVAITQSEISEFETELLEAVAKLEAEALETLLNDEQESPARS